MGWCWRPQHFEGKHASGRIELPVWYVKTLEGASRLFWRSNSELNCKMPEENRKEEPMNKLSIGLAVGWLVLGSMAAPTASQAQIAVDMSKLTCGQYLEMSPDQSRIYAAWMSGWFNQKMGYTYIDLEAYARNVENVKAWCGTNPGELVMTGLQRATGK